MPVQRSTVTEMPSANRFRNWVAPCSFASLLAESPGELDSTDAAAPSTDDHAPSASTSSLPIGVNCTSGFASRENQIEATCDLGSYPRSNVPLIVATVSYTHLTLPTSDLV